MDAGGWILLLIVAACVVALIVVARKRRELEESMSYETDFDSGLSANKPDEDTKDPVKSPPQVTVYEYHSAKKMQLCALCDGENDALATHCYICGQPLN